LGFGARKPRVKGGVGCPRAGPELKGTPDKTKRGLQKSIIAAKSREKKVKNVGNAGAARG